MSHYKALLVVFGCLLLAKGQAFIHPLYSVDAWNEATLWDEGATHYGHFLSQYRFGLAALLALFRQFEYSGVQVAFSSVLLACGLSAVASLFAYLTIDPTGRRIPYLIFAVIFCLHPFTTEIFTFVDVTLFVCLALAIGLLGTLLVVRAHNVNVWMVGVALIVAALSIYQVTLHYILITLLLSIVASLVRGESIAPVVRALVITLFSTALCFAIAKGINAVLHIPTEVRGSLISLAKLPSRISVVWDALTLAFWPPQRLIPPVATWVSIGALSLAVLTILYAIARNRGIAMAALSSAAIIGAVLWIAGLSIIGSVVWLVPRVLSAVAVLLGGLLALGWMAGSVAVRRILTVCSIVLAFAYIASDNRILFDQWRVNQWDSRQALRIFGRFEELPEFSKLQTIILLGGRYGHTAPLPSAYKDLNLSSLAPGLAYSATFQQAIGYDLRHPTASETAAGNNYCKSAPKWPAPQSVTIIGAVGIVCLGG
ncbi:hypothetical protein FHR70_001767 [Microvirga lupini]|uniref:Glycosyltransferase RgtA/B/C/D-like domain-containing protein n=1 Tax=Microvirga lupini TaxID=420324 RepID=A0A7W4YX83_9HYPH|nr:glucosyltransferase domain-containing protein [Microvirga lupini]MBB3018713.1 hypothetical protein [Microvirga lupini]